MGFFDESRFEKLRAAYEKAAEVAPYAYPTQPHRCVVHPEGGFCPGCGMLYVADGPNLVRAATRDEYRRAVEG